VPSTENAASDGHDYIEGNGGDDVIFGNLGQDDIVGGSSSLFGLTDAASRPDGADLVFRRRRDGHRAPARRGRRRRRGHVLDADVIAGDNADILRIVARGTAPGAARYVGFQYDTYSPNAKLVVRAVRLLDYTPGGPDLRNSTPAALGDRGAGDELHGESGDDAVYGMAGDDVLFGEGQDDDLIGGWGNDWISGRQR
jgi:Ca2+-binding RTX toxin-like protein